jgi:DNA-binding FrmR family transcriptional regulator
MAHHKLPEVAKRMARIEGHVKGIRKMIAEEKTYPEIVQQITAVRASLDSVMEVIVEDLVEGVTHQNSTKNKAAAMELKDTVSHIL